MLTYDYKNMLSDAVGEYGASSEELDKLQQRLVHIHTTIVNKHEKSEYGFARVIDNSKMVEQVENVAQEIAQQFKNLIVIGIGGSELGARALIRAFRNEQAQRTLAGMNIYFLGAGTDPEEIHEVLAQVDLKETAINIVSKSGSTIEPMSTFLYVRQQLINAVGFKNHGAHIVATTSPEHGILKALMDSEGHTQLPIPQEVGGRFSVLSSVGLLPAACAGINVQELLSGARAMNGRILKNSDRAHNPALAFAALHYLAFTKRNQNISVMMPYSYALEYMGTWYQQLWAESLGKERDREGKLVYTGQTPIAARGPSDQHSQLQLWNEGPYDKIITFIKTGIFRNDIQLPNDLSFIPALQYLEGKYLGDIMNIELEATRQSLTEHKRPNGTIVLSDISEKTIGALFLFFEWAVVYMGALLNIDQFTQPGVEQSKELIREKLKG